MSIVGTIFIAFLFGGVGVALLIGAIFLQIHLSKKENKWLGLILPIMTFAFSLIIVFGTAAYGGTTTITSETIMPDGTVQQQIIEEQTVINKGSLALQIAYAFMICNIPTMIFMLIYFGCRQKINKMHEINKMNIQDLE